MGRALCPQTILRLPCHRPLRISFFFFFSTVWFFPCSARRSTDLPISSSPELRLRSQITAAPPGGCRWARGVSAGSPGDTQAGHLLGDGGLASHSTPSPASGHSYRGMILRGRRAGMRRRQCPRERAPGPGSSGQGPGGTGVTRQRSVMCVTKRVLSVSQLSWALTPHSSHTPHTLHTTPHTAHAYTHLTHTAAPVVRLHPRDLIAPTAASQA